MKIPLYKKFYQNKNKIVFVRGASAGNAYLIAVITLVIIHPPSALNNQNNHRN
jgi:hypothetical protein